MCAGEFAPVLAVPGLTPAEEDISNQAPPNHIPFLPPPPLSQADPVTIIPPGCHRLSHCFSCKGFRSGGRPGPRAPRLPLATLARRLKHGHWPRREAFETRKRRFRRLRRRSGARLARSRELRGVPRRRREVRVPQRRREARVCASLRLRHLCVGRREQSFTLVMAASVKSDQLPLFYPRGGAAQLRGISTFERSVVYCL